MKLKILIIAILACIAVGILMAALLWYASLPWPNTAPAMLDYKNLSYTIENRLITLVDGYSEVQVAPGSALKIITRYFGNEAIGDLNGDGLKDVAFLLTQEARGTSAFYFLAVALKTDAGWQSAGAMFLGDRIAQQSTQINDGIIAVNYAQRKPDEPMTAAPSIGVSKYFNIKNGILQIITIFNLPFTLAPGEEIEFSDSLMVGLKEINDSRCKPEVVCVWAGELSPVLYILGGSAGNVTQEVRLGSVTAKKVNKGGYLFELQSATKTTATIVATKESQTAGTCYIGGCSGQICSGEKDVASTCEYKEEYACYKSAICARQADGQCGWTQTQELRDCLGNSR